MKGEIAVVNVATIMIIVQNTSDQNTIHVGSARVGFARFKERFDFVGIRR